MEPVAVEIDDETSDRYDGDELAAFREAKPIHSRVRTLEKHGDDIRKELAAMNARIAKSAGDMSAGVARLEGKLEGQEILLTETLTLVRQGLEREHVTFTAKVDVDKARALSEVKLDEEQALDKIDGKKTTRATVAKAVGAILSGGTIVELLHRLGGL